MYQYVKVSALPAPLEQIADDNSATNAGIESELRLIHAAPALLNALIMMVESAGPKLPAHHYAVAFARDAIAKARK
jgi:hypothetical protein